MPELPPNANYLLMGFSGMDDFTPGPWIWADWTIHYEDRPAQKAGDPYWTLVEGEFCSTLTRGPIGRKAMHPESIVWGEGSECEGINASDADRRLIAAAPELYEALRKIAAVEGCQIISSKNAATLFQEIAAAALKRI